MIKFEQIIILLKEYKENHGDCLVPQSYTTESGVRLGKIVNSIRIGVRKTSQTEKQILNELWFVWKVNLSFEEVIILLKEYKEKYGNCLVPQSYTTESGIRLGSIVRSIRTGARKTSETQKQILNKIEFVWEVRREFPFEEIIMLLKEYKEEYGDCLVPQSYTAESGICLGFIVNNMRKGHRKTSKVEKEELNKLGFVWKVCKKGENKKE